MPSAARTLATSLAAAVKLALALALAGAALAALTSQARASEGSPAGSDAHDGSVFCDPATLPEGAVCSLTPGKERGEADPVAREPASEATDPDAGSEATAERLPSSADPGEGQSGAGVQAAGASPTPSSDVASVPLARTGLRASLPAVLGACLLLGGVGLLATQRMTRLYR